MLINVPMTLPVPDQTLGHVKKLVARVLLEHAGDSTPGRPQLTQRDIAALVGTDWERVHMSLKSLQDEGAIRIEHHRLIVKKELLQKIAGQAESVCNLSRI